MPRTQSLRRMVRAGGACPDQSGRGRLLFRDLTTTSLDTEAMISSIGRVSGSYDLRYDANTVGADLVVVCWISHGPRTGDTSFDPSPGDHVVIGDDEETPRRARVVRRDGDRVSVQVELSGATTVA